MTSPEYKYKQIDDCYKFASWCIRRCIQAVSGREVGDTALDEKMGQAMAAVYPPSVLAEMSDDLKVALNAAAGAWKGVK